MKVKRRGELVQLRLVPLERGLLVDLFGQLAAMLDNLNPDDPVHQRLYPEAHRDDAQIAQEYRELTESGLQQERQARLTQCSAEIDAAADDAGFVSLQLSRDDTRRWLQSLNDLRLAIGTRLGVTEENSALEPSGPNAEAWAGYHWLTGLQDALTNAVAG